MNFKKIFLFFILVVAGISKANEPVLLSSPFDSFSSFLNYFKTMILNRDFSIKSNQLETMYCSNKFIKNSFLIISILGTYGWYKALQTKEGIQTPKTLLKWCQFLGSAALTMLSIFSFVKSMKFENKLIDMQKYLMVAGLDMPRMV